MKITFENYIFGKININSINNNKKCKFPINKLQISRNFKYPITLRRKNYNYKSFSKNTSAASTFPGKCNNLSTIIHE